ncbi:MAG: response regulator [Ignavibacteria bacterium]|nr:response regulator [Ignavibacteria bacterium]
MQKKGTGLSSVLYIEDDSMNWEIVNMFLKGYYQLDTVSESSEAMEKIHANKYAVILLDISLGKGTSGLELAKEIKKLTNYQDVPIIAVTAHALREDENRILKGACTHYVAKPFTKKTLLDTLKKALPN